MRQEHIKFASVSWTAVAEIVVPSPSKSAKNEGIGIPSSTVKTATKQLESNKTNTPKYT